MTTDFSGFGDRMNLRGFYKGHFLVSIQEGAADWDEDWDKFEDEGFTFVKELTLDVQNVIAPPKPKATSIWKEKASTDDDLTAAASSNADLKSEKPTSTGDQIAESGSAYAQSEDGSARSPSGSLAGRSSLESSHEFPDAHLGKNIGADASPYAKESQSDHGGAESMLSVDKSFDEPTWGTFDANDDIDSVWGFNPDHAKDPDHERHRENSFFSGDLGLNPIRTESPREDSMFQKKSPFNFADSIPATPLFNSSNSPPRYSEASEEHSFDHFSRFDSFSTHDSGFFPPLDTFARFDSIRSTTDYNHSRGFPSPPRETLTRFDSIQSTTDFNHSRGFQSFDDNDPFGTTGPFKISSESQTPRRGSDNWSAF